MNTRASQDSQPRVLPTRNLYFTSWQFVRPGGFAYVDADGRAVPTDGQRGDEGVRYRPTAPRGVRLVAQRAERVKLDEPLGAEPSGWPTALTVVRDEGRYKCWYAIFPPPPAGDAPPGRGQNHHICYAESDDGFAWRKPACESAEFAGVRHDNVVFRPAQSGPGRGIHGHGVFLDDGGDPAERYKMVYMGHFTADEVAAYRRAWPDDVDPMAVGPDGSAWGVAGAVSADGRHWRALPEPMLIHHTDTFLSACRDARRGQCVCYYRTWLADLTGPEGGNFGGIGKRSVGRAVSDDFRHWRNPEVLVTPGADTAPSHLWYGPCKTSLPGCPDQHVMFPFRWKLEDDSMDVPLLSTPDGWVWAQVPGGAVLSPAQPGQWDGGYVIPCPNLIELPDGRWALPYRGFPIPHKYPRLDPAARALYRHVVAGTGYAVWPKGRLVAMECADEGEFATIGVQPAGDRLFLNASVLPTGWIKVGLSGLWDAELGRHPDVPGRTLAEADPIVGADGAALPVTWAGRADMGLDGRPVILNVQLRQAKLFGIEFR